MKFEVFGVPQPKGSKTSFPIINRKTGEPVRGKGGRIIIATTDANPKAKPWMMEVKFSFLDAGGELMDGPLRLACVFTTVRPKGHFNSKMELNKKGLDNPFPIVRPDATKLIRAIEDGLNGVAWRDDSQVVLQLAVKEYGPQAKATIEITYINDGTIPSPFLQQ